MSPHVEFRYISNSESETRRLGELAGKAAESGDVVGLVGDLGAGKTQFVKGLAVGAGVKSAALVTSPTFVLLNSYSGRLPVRHYDLYRLDSPDLEALGYLDLLAPSLTVVEWSDKAGDLLGDLLEVRIEVTGATERRLEARATGPRGRALAARIRSLLEAGRLTPES
ncbi:MAG TPA: tRNA (adenosine(37)-N6)-threonylcarbamoyltransferase complex ATPase subunit type 1 TsaE [Planctomycetota bacterium]